MSNYMDTISNADLQTMKEYFYKLGWGQNETMWKCWCQAMNYAKVTAIDDFEAELSATKQKLAKELEIGDKLFHKLQAAEQRIREAQNQESSKLEQSDVDAVRAEFERAYRSECFERGMVPNFDTKESCYTNWTTYDAFRMWQFAYRAGIAVREGWKLVPIEPTSKMLDEIHLVDDFTYAALSARYKAMLAAAPKD